MPREGSVRGSKPILAGLDAVAIAARDALCAAAVAG